MTHFALFFCILISRILHCFLHMNFTHFALFFAYEFDAFCRCFLQFLKARFKLQCNYYSFSQNSIPDPGLFPKSDPSRMSWKQGSILGWDNFWQTVREFQCQPRFDETKSTIIQKTRSEKLTNDIQGL